MKRQGSEGLSLDRSVDEQELSRLMRESQGGDVASYRQLLTRMRPMLEKYVQNSLARFGMSNRVSFEDIVQEILLAVHTKRQTYDSEQYFLPWMYAVARYKVIDHLRKNKMNLKYAVSLEDELENIEALMPLELAAELDVESLLASLPPKQKQVLQLVKLEGLSVEEAALRTGFSKSDIKVTVHRAIQSLQDLVKEGSREN